MRESIRSNWQAKIVSNGQTLYAFHVYIQGGKYHRVFAASDVHAWEIVQGKFPSVRITKIKNAPSIAVMEY